MFRWSEVEKLFVAQLSLKLTLIAAEHTYHKREGATSWLDTTTIIIVAAEEEGVCGGHRNHCK